MRTANPISPGFALTTVLAARPNTVVFAGARNPSGASELQALAKSLPDRIHVVKLDSTDVEAHNTAVEQIKKEVGRLDVVIANAGQQLCIVSVSFRLCIHILIVSRGMQYLGFDFGHHPGPDEVSL